MGLLKARKERERDNVLEEKKCFYCKRLNPGTVLLCGFCGVPLDKEKAKREIAKKILSDSVLKVYGENPEKLMKLTKKKRASLVKKFMKGRKKLG